MFLHTWNKYLPVIRVLLKRSVRAEQILEMNSSDFQRAAGGKKVKFTFWIPVIKGRTKPGENFPPIAKDLFSVLQQDHTTNKFMQQNDVEFGMDSNFRLTIKNTTELAVENNPEEIVEAAKETPSDASIGS